MKKYLSFISPKLIVAVAAAGLCLAPSTKAADEPQSSSQSKLSATDRKFVKKAYKGGLTEVQNGEMAKEKASNDATKEVAERMVTDHAKVNEELRNIAKEENLDLSKVHAKTATISGDNFDKEYLTMLKADHEKDIAEFEKEANDAKAGEDHDVPTFAKKTLPTLKEHLQMVDDALAKVK